VKACQHYSLESMYARSAHRSSRLGWRACPALHPTDSSTAQSMQKQRKQYTSYFAQIWIRFDFAFHAVVSHQEGFRYCNYLDCKVKAFPTTFIGNGCLKNHIEKFRRTHRCHSLYRQMSSGVPVDETTLAKCEEKMPNDYDNESDSEDEDD
jgi:hypothetical protein